MQLDFKTPRVGEKKIMVRFDGDDYRKIKAIAQENKESMGQIIRVVIKAYLKENE